MLQAQLVATALGGGRATAAGVLEGEKGGDNHAKATGGEAGQRGWHGWQGLPLEQEFDSSR